MEQKCQIFIYSVKQKCHTFIFPKLSIKKRIYIQEEYFQSILKNN